MKRTLTIVSGLALLALAAYSSPINQSASLADVSGRDISKSHEAAISLNTLDLQTLTFTENQGQWDERVKFRANAGGATMWYTTNGVYYQFTRHMSRFDSSLDGNSNLPNDILGQDSDSYEQLTIKASFIGANPSPKIVGENLMGYKCNYFIGNDPDEWHTDVPNYKAVVFEDVYDDIDLKYYGNGKQMEYDFIVSPGADPNQIMVQYDGAQSISVNDNGELVVETDWGTVTELRPLVYQFGAIGCIPIEGRYVVLTDNTFGFDLGDRYDPMLALVIDPVLSYSTYLGGNNWDYGYSIAADIQGNAYITGDTRSTDFPTLNPFQSNQSGRDAFVAKFSSEGNELVYSTYMGGDDEDYGYDIAVDDAGFAFVTGETQSTNFPLENPYQTDQPMRDAFVVKLNGEGNGLVYSTYLGGSGGDEGNGIAIDSIGCAYVTGETYSTDFPTVNAYQMDQTTNDAFVTKLSSDGSLLVYSTYLGGNSVDIGHGIEVDGNGNAYVTGETNSSNFPTVNPLQPTYHGSKDAFITKLFSLGDSLIYSTYLGGTDIDYGFDIAIDAYSEVYVTGKTYSFNFPVVNPYQTDQSGPDVFIAKLRSSGSEFVYSTYLGGGDNDWGNGIAVDSNGSAYVTGCTESSNFPTVNPYQTNQSYSDAFVSKLDSSGNELVYSTYLGGSSGDAGAGIAVDGNGDAYVTGSTQSNNFPLVNPYQAYPGTFGHIFVAKLYEEPPYLCGDADASGSVDIDDVVYLIAYIFSGGPAPAPIEAGDANCSGGVDIDDVVYLIAYIFSGGYAPCDVDGDGIPDC